MNGLKKIDTDIILVGMSDLLRTLEVGQKAIFDSYRVNVPSIDSIKARLKKKEGLVFKRVNVGDEVIVQRKK